MNIGEYVVHKNNGICQIADILVPDFVSDKNKQYYLLIPIEEAKSKIYIPLDKAADSCRNIISEDEACQLIHKIHDIKPILISNEKEKEELLRDILRTGDLQEIIAVIKSLYLRMEDRKQSGKKTTVVEDKYFKLAEHTLYSELGFVLNKSTSELKDMIQNTQ